MAWTKSGTVNLTNGSAVVYGAGTAWVSGGMARPGDVFIAPGGGLYEVASVQSNTQLTLSSAYLGSTASAQTYSLVHTGLLPSELAISLSSLQSKYLTTISQLWEWETSNAATVPLTNPATGVTTNVRPIAGLVLDVNGKAPIASPSFTGTLTHSGDVVLSGSGKRIMGDFSNATIANRLMFHTSVVNGQTSIGVLPNGTSSTANLNLFGGNDPANASIGQFVNTGVEVQFSAIATGTGTYLPMMFRTGGALRLRIDTSGNVLVISPAGLGYGPGAGGTVTQATSKGTMVTLNKPCGKIIMNAASLASGASVQFALQNSLITANDVLVLGLEAVNINATADYLLSYSCATGGAYIVLTNTSSTALAQAVTINFAIIKGATS